MMGPAVPVQILAERILNSIPEGMLIALLAWLLLRLAGEQSSRTKFAVWLFALLAMAAVPFVPAVISGGSVTSTSHAELTMPASWATALVALWGVVAFFAVARLISGMVRLRKLVRESHPVSLDQFDAESRGILEDCSRVRAVVVRTSEEVRVPTAIGFFQPTILLPAWALTELSTEELCAVLRHETAHLRRRDDWTNLAQKVVRALFFFHPAVLWVERKLALEREMACDEEVLAATMDAHGYAKCLVAVAEKSFVRRSVILAQAAIGRARETSLRIAQILRVQRPGQRMYKPLLAGLAGAIALSFAFLPHVPQLVAFRDNGAELAEIAPASKSLIVPAAFHVTAKPQTGSAPQPKANPSIAMTRPQGSGDVKVVQARALRPRVMQTKLSQVPAEQLLVFTQTTDYYQHGSGIVGVTEWRVMLVTLPVQKGNQVQAPSRT